ncbi:zinc finger protein 862-like [Saccostrea cucullata]|uniref:zinc finger protein 862-like n=1 Tax=Saccostrea cuccullata TaxID=36930 RepID=UPI002ED67E05
MSKKGQQTLFDLKFVSSAAENGKRKSSDENKDQKYDKNKRKRTFQEGWKERYPWVDQDDDGLMFCKYCRSFPEFANKSSALYKGTTNLKIDPLISHDKTNEHLTVSKHYLTKKNPISNDQNNNEAVAEYRNKLLPVIKDTEIGKAFYKLSEEEKKKMTVLFNTAYAVARNGKPFSDYLYIYELNSLNGLDINGQYNNIIACENFIEAISQTLRERICDEVLMTNCVSILADGSTDAAILEQEIVYLRYVHPISGIPVCRQIDIIAVKSSDASGVLGALNAAVENGLNLKMTDFHPDNKGTPSLIMANFDGASVNFGSKSGVVAQMKKDFTNILALQCVAHKLELSILDAVKCWKYLSDTFEDIIKGIFKFYHYSPKRRRELRAIAEILEKELIHFSNVKQVRWLASKARAIDAVKKNFEQVVTHLEHNNLSSTYTEGASKALGYVKKITTVKFVKVLHFMLDFLPVVANLSKSFQSETVLLCEVTILVDGAILALEGLKTSNGANMKEFLENFDTVTSKYGNVKLTNKPQTLNYSDDADVKKFLSDVITYLMKRFDALYKPPFSLFSVFNVKNWPVLVPELGKYGVDEIMSIVSHECFSFLFNEAEKAVVLSQWSLLKAKVRHLRHVSLVDIYSSVIAEDRQSKHLPVICKVIEVMMTLSPSTASCERGFSTQNIVKTNRRTKLTQNNLRNQLLLMLEGPDLKDFRAEKSIAQWLLSANKSRHVHGHKLHEKDSEYDDETNMSYDASKVN